jgi:pyrophosphate--fructose-6-phosphate 1-phosphotransferase
MEVSALQNARYAYTPKLPACLSRPLAEIALEFGAPTEAAANRDELRALFRHSYGKPIASCITCINGKNDTIKRRLNAGVILSGGQAPGGHNVIAGLYDGLKKANPDSTLYGFLGGPSGLLEDKAVVFTDELIDRYRNTGGFDIIGSGRTKIETPEQFAAVLETAKKRALDAVVIIG